MLQPHQRAAMMPNEPKVHWHQFLVSRYRSSDESLALVIQNVAQQSPHHADLKGQIEVSPAGSLPVIFEFAGVLNLETREVSVQQTQPAIIWTGQISANGRVVALRKAGGGKVIHLVHEETLAEFS